MTDLDEIEYIIFKLKNGGYTFETEWDRVDYVKMICAFPIGLDEIAENSYKLAPGNRRYELHWKDLSKSTEIIGGDFYIREVRKVPRRNQYVPTPEYFSTPEVVGEEN